LGIEPLVTTDLQLLSLDLKALKESPKHPTFMSPAEDIPFEDGDYLIVYQKCKNIINEVFGQTCLTLPMAYIIIINMIAGRDTLFSHVLYRG
jgi:hypothetical protein